MLADQTGVNYEQQKVRKALEGDMIQLMFTVISSNSPSTQRVQHPTVQSC